LLQSIEQVATWNDVELTPQQQEAFISTRMEVPALKEMAELTAAAFVWIPQNGKKQTLNGLMDGLDWVARLVISCDPELVLSTALSGYHLSLVDFSIDAIFQAAETNSLSNVLKLRSQVRLIEEIASRYPDLVSSHMKNLMETSESVEKDLVFFLVVGLTCPQLCKAVVPSLLSIIDPSKVSGYVALPWVRRMIILLLNARLDICSDVGNYSPLF
jgi:hypothetical protein